VRGPKVGVHVWRLSAQTNLQFEMLLKQRLEVQDDSDEAYALEEEIRSLPGFPRNVDPDVDVIMREVTTIR
jgi:hypothetical protein